MEAPPESRRGGEGDRAGFGVEALVVGLAVMLLYVLLVPSGYVGGSYGDDGVYLTLGRAIASGEGYRSLHLPGAPPHVQYPPGLPALLAVLWGVAGEADGVVGLARAVNILLAGVVAALVWWIGRSRLELAPGSALLPLVPLFFDSSLQYAAVPLTEPFFMAGWALALLLFARMERGWEPDGLACMSLGLTLGATALLRSQAIALMGAFVLATAVRWGWRAGLRVLLWAAALPLLWVAAKYWLALGADLGPQRSYLEDVRLGTAAEVGRVLTAALANVRGYILLFTLYSSPSILIGALAVGVFTVLTLAGMRDAWRRDHALVLTVLLNGILVAAWPYNIDRLVLSALPFAGLLAARQVQTGVDRGSSRAVAAGLTALLLFLGLFGYRQAQIRDMAREAVAAGGRTDFWTPSWLLPWVDRYAREAGDWIDAEVPEDASVAAGWPATLYLRTDRLILDTETSARRFAASEPDPGEHLANILLRWRPVAVVVAHPEYRAARDVAAIARACPQLLVEDPVAAGGSHPRFYHVAADLACLEREWANQGWGGP